MTAWGFTSYPFDDSENAPLNSNLRYDPSEEGAHLVVGRTTERRSPPDRVGFE